MFGATFKDIFSQVVGHTSRNLDADVTPDNLFPDQLKNPELDMSNPEF